MTEIFSNAVSQTSVIELLAVIFSIVYVVLAAYQIIWCWLAAIISVSLYIWLCYSATLYSETGLQVFYLIMAFYGWNQWLKKNKNEEKPKIRTLEQCEYILFFAIGILFSLPLYFLTKKFTDAAMPLSDSIVTGFSIVTTYMTAKKILENWLWWVAIDSLAAYIYFSRNLHLTSVLYVIYIIIALAGFVKWRNEYLRQNDD